MENCRTYGTAPFLTAVVHGGPGAPGEVAPVARELSRSRGVLEPIQTADSLEGQVAELGETLLDRADGPVALIGHSWGAWLAYLVAARRPESVGKLVLVGSGPFEEKYAASIMDTRMSHLDEIKRARVRAIEAALEDPSSENREELFSEYGNLLTKADTFDGLPQRNEVIDFQPHIYGAVWPRAAELRRSGELLEAGRSIRCPVTAIHGDHDSHPAEGVEEPLMRVLPRLRFVLLEKCGHSPWIERHARDAFFRILESELGDM